MEGAGILFEARSQVRLRWVIILHDPSKRGVPMHDRWEYKVLVGAGGMSPHWVDADDGTDYGGVTLSTELLNRLGQEGSARSRRPTR
jgi:hypothetical protein